MAFLPTKVDIQLKTFSQRWPHPKTATETVMQVMFLNIQIIKHPKREVPNNRLIPSKLFLALRNLFARIVKHNPPIKKHFLYIKVQKRLPYLKMLVYILWNEVILKKIDTIKQGRTRRVIIHKVIKTVKLIMYKEMISAPPRTTALFPNVQPKTISLVHSQW